MPRSRGHATGSIIDTPTLSVGDIDVSESAGIATFSVTTSKRLQQDVTVTFHTQDQGAVAGSDYTATASTFTILSGSTGATIDIPVLDDALFEVNEQFVVVLDSVVNATPTSTSASATIADDDRALLVSDAAVVEGETGLRAAVFTITLAGPAADHPITVDFATADGSALAGNDYLQTYGAVAFAPGESQKQITIPVNGDRTVEPDETFFVDLSHAGGGVSIVDARGQGTIRTDELSLSVADVSLDEGQPEAFFVVTLAGLGATEPVTVDFATNDGSALAGLDYEETHGSLTFLPGEMQRRIQVPVTDDNTFEAAQTFSIVLSNPANATILQATATGTIRDNDAPPHVSVISPVECAEGDDGATEATVAVRLSAASDVPVTVDFSTLDGTATAAEGDYEPVSGLLVFEPGVFEQLVVVRVLGDVSVESDESFSIVLSNATNAVIETGTGEVIIRDNEERPALFVEDLTVLEGTGIPTEARFAVSLSKAVDYEVRVDYATLDATATAVGGDYVPVAGTLVFAPNETTKTVMVAIGADAVAEPDESFFLTLTSPLAGGAKAQATLVNDDTLIEISDEQVIEGDGGVAIATFTLTRTAGEFPGLCRILDLRRHRARSGHRL